MRTRAYDVVVVGAGTAGSFAAARAAEAGLDVALLERKDEETAGHIACGDALKGADAFPDAIAKSRLEPTITNTAVDHGRFEIPQEDTVLEIPVPGELGVVDRWAYGQAIIDGAVDAGAEAYYETLVQSVIQDNGRIAGVEATRAGEPEAFEAEVVIDAAGSMSILQDTADFGDSHFDTNVAFHQFCSAYREIVEVPEPVPWHDALVFKPTARAAGYLWYFPRTEHVINAGLGFQMTEEPMTMVDTLKRDLDARPEFDGVRVINKLGAALPTRRPYDSAVAPGYLAVGDAAGHVNPTTGGGMAGAAYAGDYAATAAIEAIAAGDLSEAALWPYNVAVMDHFGGRYAALDVYNILSTAIDVDELMGLLASLPGEKLAEALYSGSTSVGWRLALSSAIRTLGHWGTIYGLYKTKRVADRLLEHYDAYPADPESFARWQADRDDLMEEVYAVTGADPKY
ncbi:MAG: geranylgeranyl reductase family protein [Halobacteriales archaeon]